jgi:hypothetical protein
VCIAVIKEVVKSWKGNQMIVGSRWKRSLAALASLLLLAAFQMPVAVAAACEGAFLEDTSEQKEEFAEGADYEQHLVYRRNGGPVETGFLLEEAALAGPFTMLGTCEGMSLKNGEGCTVKVRCKAAGAETIKVKGTEPGITWWSQRLRC